MSLEMLTKQAIIISLDIDDKLFEKLQQINNSGLVNVELYSTDIPLLTEVIAKFPRLKVSAVGILNTQELENCYQAHVHYASSPGFLPALAQTANVYSMNYIPGVATISEAMAAMNIGYTHVRPYPADLGFCALLNKSIPSLQLYPAEIDWNEAEHFLNLPSVKAISIHNPNDLQLATLSTGILT